MKRQLVLSIWLGILIGGVVGCYAAAEPPPATQLPIGAPKVSQSSSISNAQLTPALQAQPNIGRLVLATQVDATGAPQDDVSAVAASTPRIYATVQAHNLRHGMTVRAIWKQGGSEIARSEHRVPEDVADSGWIPLSFKPNQAMSAGQYTVEIWIDDQLFQSLVFQVSGTTQTGGSSQSQLLFVPEFDIQGNQASPTNSFPPGTSQVVAIFPEPPPDVTRPLTARWYHDGAVLTELGPDPIVSGALRTFTLHADQPLPAGQYRVDLLIDGELLASGQFYIQGVRDIRSTAMVEDMAVVREVDPNTLAPTGPSLTQIEAPETINVTILVRDLAPTDILELVWIAGSVEVARMPLTGQTIAHNWVRFQRELSAPPEGSETRYRVIALLNGQPAAERRFFVR